MGQHINSPCAVQQLTQFGVVSQRQCTGHHNRPNNPTPSVPSPHTTEGGGNEDRETETEGYSWFIIPLWRSGLGKAPEWLKPLKAGIYEMLRPAASR